MSAGMEDPRESEIQATRLALTRTWNGLCNSRLGEDDTQEKLGYQIAQLTPEQKMSLVDRAVRAALAWEVVSKATSSHGAESFEMQPVSTNIRPSLFSPQPEDVRFRDTPLRNLAVFASTDPTLQTFLISKATEHQLYKFLSAREVNSWKLTDESGVSAVLSALDALSLTKESSAMTTMANLVVASTFHETSQMTLRYWTNSERYASDEFIGALIYICTLREDVSPGEFAQRTTDLKPAIKDMLLEKLTTAQKWGTISDGAKIEHLVGWMNSTDVISDRDKVSICDILGEGAPSGLQEMCAPIRARKEVGEIDRRLVVLNERMRYLEKNIEVKLTLEPGQILSVDGLEEGIEHIKARVTYNSVLLGYDVYEFKKEGWGNVFSRRPATEPSEPFTVEMTAKKDLDGQFYKDRSRLIFVAKESDVLIDGPATAEFRAVLEVGYHDHSKTHSNFPPISVPWYHNPYSYRNGICLHADYGVKPLLNDLNPKGKFHVFEKALEAYFLVKGYPMSKVSLRDLHQQQIDAVRNEISGLEERASSLRELIDVRR